MTAAATIDSNVTELAWAEESIFKTLGTLPIWHPAEPNQYGDLGGSVVTVAREPIASDRQRRKPVIVDLDATVDYEQDVTQNNLADQMQGFLFANYRKKAEFEITNKITNTDGLTITSVSGTNTINIVSGGGALNFATTQKIRTKGFTNAANNGVLTITSVTATTIVVSDTLTNEASPPVTAQVASAVGSVSTTTFTVTKNGTNFLAGDLVETTGFTNTGNNGLLRVSSSTATTVVITGTTLTTEATPPDAAKLVAVGFQFASGDVTITNSGTAYPTLGATAKDLTQLGITPGEWVYVGDGTAAAFSFATSANNGFARVRSVTASTITFDKTYATMVTDAGTSKTIRIYLGRVLKNETGVSIVRRTYNFERKLGAPDTASPTLIQSEYVIGAVASELELKVPKAAKITANLKYVGADSETRSAATGIKSGTRATLTALDAYNSTSDVSKLKLATISTTDACPSALFEYLSEIDISINNNVKGNKAIATLGAFEAATGSFDVSAKLQAYFANISATSTVRAGTSLSLDFHLVKNNAGISIDLPQLVASKALNSVKRNESIEVPLESNASSGLELDSTLNHTMLMVFFDYLPSVADA